MAYLGAHAQPEHVEPCGVHVSFYNGDNDEGSSGAWIPPSYSCCSDDPLQWDSGQDEAVEVNQRALIDKVLARYSGEFTGVFRVFSTKADGLNTNV